MGLMMCSAPGESEDEHAENICPSIDDLFLSTQTLSCDGTTCTIEVGYFNTSHPSYSMLIATREGAPRPEDCVLKTVNSNKLSSFNREVNVLMQVNHPHIVTYFGHAQQPDGLFIFQERCCGGTLTSLIRDSPLSEDQAASLMAQLIEALEYLHARNIVHRDVKPANIMLASPEQDRLVLIDFGQARKIFPGEEFGDWAGTPAFMAPECTRNRTGEELKKTDMWAAGICAFAMLTKSLPFRTDAGLRGLMHDVCQKNVRYPKYMSKTAKSFVSGLLKRESAKRLSASEALKHKWVLDYRDTTAEEEFPDPEIFDDHCVDAGGIDLSEW